MGLSALELMASPFHRGWSQRGVAEAALGAVEIRDELQVTG
jgi:hypothetical protein